MKQTSLLFGCLAPVVLMIAVAGCGGGNPPAKQEPVEAGSSEAAEHEAEHTHSEETAHADHHEGHDHAHEGEESHDHASAATLSEAVQEVVALNEQIREGLAEGDTAKADGPVHKIGHVLEEVEQLAGKASLDDTQKQDVKLAIEKLFDAFGKIDEKLHGGKGADYQDVAPQIDEAIQKLKDIAN